MPQLNIKLTGLVKLTSIRQTLYSFDFGGEKRDEKWEKKDRREQKCRKREDRGTIIKLRPQWFLKLGAYDDDDDGQW